MTSYFEKDFYFYFISFWTYYFDWGNMFEESKITETHLYFFYDSIWVCHSIFFFGIFLKLLAPFVEEIYFLFFGIFLKLLYNME